MAQSSPSMTPQLPRVDSLPPPPYDHAVSPAPGSETELVAAAIFEMHRRQDELDHERWMRDHERDREQRDRERRERDPERTVYTKQTLCHSLGLSNWVLEKNCVRLNHLSDMCTKHT